MGWLAQQGLLNTDAPSLRELQGSSDKVLACFCSSCAERGAARDGAPVGGTGLCAGRSARAGGGS